MGLKNRNGSQGKGACLTRLNGMIHGCREGDPVGRDELLSLIRTLEGDDAVTGAKKTMDYPEEHALLLEAETSLRAGDRMYGGTLSDLRDNIVAVGPLS